MIISGAGLPLSLPRFVGDSDIALVPIVSSGRAASMILRSWTRKSGRVPDAFVVEGPLAGGHLGFTCEDDIVSPDNRIERLVRDVVDVVEQFATESSSEPIPVIAAGGVFTRSDVDRMFNAGASGVQVASLFVCTHECTVDEAFKNAYISATEKDVVLFRSPVGMLARAIRTPLLDKVLRGEKTKFPCAYQCLRTCAGPQATFCIARALLNARDGNIEEGLVFAGSNVDKITEITSVQAVMDKLTLPG
jgi:nitronate monooxygenase